jgi:hypothetical protein
MFAVEELDIQDVLKLSNLGADCRLRDIETCGGGSETASLNDGEKVFEETEFQVIVKAHADLRGSAGAVDRYRL